MQEKFYNYIYLDPRKPGKYSYDGLSFSLLYEPFYVGKGTGSRKFAHLNIKALSKNSYKNNKIKKISNMREFILQINSNLGNQEVKEIEMFLILKIGRYDLGGPLTNKTDGGDGCFDLIQGISRRWTEEGMARKVKASKEFLTGKTMEEILGSKERAQKANIKRSIKQKGIPKPHSESHRSNLKLAHKRRWEGKTFDEVWGEKSSEMRQKISKSGSENNFFGKKHSDETKKKWKRNEQTGYYKASGIIGIYEICENEIKYSFLFGLREICKHFKISAYKIRESIKRFGRFSNEKIEITYLGNKTSLRKQ